MTAFCLYHPKCISLGMRLGLSCSSKQLHGRRHQPLYFFWGQLLPLSQRTELVSSVLWHHGREERT